MAAYLGEVFLLTGQDQWIARCPSHVDRTPSLSIAEKDDRVLIHCYAGCCVNEVVDAVGLKITDLFPPRQDRGKPVKHRPDYRGMWMLSKHAFWVLVIAAADLISCFSFGRGKAITMGEGGAVVCDDPDLYER